MSTEQSNLTMEQLAVRLIELEHVNAQMQKELIALREAQPTVPTQSTPLPRRAKNATRANGTEERKSRRRLLRTGFEVAAAAVGAGVLLEMNNNAAHAFAPAADHPGNFTSSSSSTPAVKASGTNGANGVTASSDTGDGVLATSGTLDGVFGIGVNGVHGQSASATNAGVWGENTNAGYGVYATSNGGFGVYGSGLYGIYGVSTTSDGVFGTGVNGVHGQSASATNAGVWGENTNAGYGVYATSNGGVGAYAQSNGGTALQVNGTIQVQGNAVGQATIASGQKSVTVSTTAATTASNIVLTPLNKYKGTLWVTRAAGSFTINTSMAQTSNIVFTYLIVN